VQFPGTIISRVRYFFVGLALWIRRVIDLIWSLARFRSVVGRLWETGHFRDGKIVLSDEPLVLETPIES